jgi:hypothetical protein
MLTGSLAVVIVGSAVSYGMLHGQAPDQKTAYRTVILTGRARYEDGKPAGGVRIDAQIQDAATRKMMGTEKPGLLSTRVMQLSGNMTRTRPDGTYKLAVGADLPYNILLLPNNLLREGEDDGSVAAAAEGVSGHKNQTITVPDLILTPGAFVTGTVTGTNSKAVEGVSIGSYGPERPTSSAAIVDTLTDAAGHYRLRVAPGKNGVYVSDGRYNGYTDVQAKAKGLMKAVSVTAGQSATADFQVTPR